MSIFGSERGVAARRRINRSIHKDSRPTNQMADLHLHVVDLLIQAALGGAETNGGGISTLEAV